ncbi:MAG: glutamine--fructose-6-phosphate transaminase (isomerizing) [Candidatus Bathyarchaeia archaeon]
MTSGSRDAVKRRSGVEVLCGIFGITLQEGDAAPIICQALERLEYRGYDSVGLATVSRTRLEVRKAPGSIRDVKSRLHLDEMAGSIGVGHTRWATHGMPSVENAHPHTSCRGDVAVVHNGIVENFLELRRELEGRGHSFRSRTDTEVIPHLVEEYLNDGEDFAESVRLAARQLEGSYAVAAISTAEPTSIVCVRKESPLVIGLGDSSNYCASDVSAFLPLTRRAVFLEEDDLAVLKSGQVQLMNFKTGQILERDVVDVTWSMEDATRGGYRHFMLKEIHEQPYAMRNVLRIQRIYYDLMASKLDKAEQIYLLACGTSYHACLAASYFFTSLAKIKAQPVIASQFIEQYGHTLDERSAVLAVSQSGETADTLEAVRFAKGVKTSVFGITNVMGSTLTRLSEVYIGQNSGPEIGVAATKTFTSQLSVLARLAQVLAEKRRAVADEKIAEVKDGLLGIPAAMEQVLSVEPRVRELAHRYRDRSSFCFLARGINVTTALEARLKLLELSYIPSLAYPAGESKHGFIAVVEPGYPVIFVAPRDTTRQKTIGSIMEMKARGASTIGVIESGDEELRALLDDCVEVPVHVADLLTPLIYVIPLQLFAYWMAVERGCDPDRPRNLAKSVTVE